MYNDSDIQYLKQTSIVEYNWTTPSCFTYASDGADSVNLEITGMWVGKETNTNISIIENKNNVMNSENNSYGLIKNEVVSTITDEERVVIEKLNKKTGNKSNETTLANVLPNEYKQVIKIIRTSERELITPKYIPASNLIILKTTYSKNGIKLIADKDGNIISNTENATFNTTDEEQYIFYYVDNIGNIKKYKVSYGIGRPNIKYFNKNTTFYVTYDDDGNEISEVPIGEKAPVGWYDYDKQEWANIVCRDNGDELYYVWIPRYMYILNDNETVTAKLVDLDNCYMDSFGNKISLSGTEYQLPEAFTWNGEQISGYWMSKYKLRDDSTYKPNIKGSSGIITINNVVATLGTDKKYEVYLIKDGKRIQYDMDKNEYVEGTEPTIINGNYTFTNVEPGDYSVSIIVKDSNNNFYRGICKQVTVLEPATPQAPNLTGFNPNTTFVVTYDSSGNETSKIPIGELGALSSDGTKYENTPNGWYNYDVQEWANVVTRSEGQELYYVWIPRYEYKLDSANEIADVVFISKEQTTADEGYEIPEAFTWNGEQISGYWMSKYKLRDDSTTRLMATVAGGFDTIRVSNIINNTGVDVTYEVSLIKDGIRQGDSITLKGTEDYTFTGLDYGEYSVHVAAMSGENQVAGYASQIKLHQLEEPSLIGFMVDCTYIVTYDDAGNSDETQTLREVLKDDAVIENGALKSGEVDKSKIKGVWYNYAEQKWANVVTKANNQTLYYVWVPRYEYVLDSSKQNAKVILIPRDKTTADEGYEIPEAFIWNGTPISGYWMCKYKLRS